MRHILLSFVLVLVILPLAARQDGEDFMQSVHEAIEKGDAEKLVIYFHDPVDLKIDKKKGMYSVDQAEMMLNIFFNTNPPTAVTLEAHADSGQEKPYSIQRYVSGANKYHIYFLAKRVEGAFCIIQFYIEKDPE